MVYNAQIYTAPLLPFEKQLIATIGATEDEYRLLVTEAIKRGGRRPAGYEHIPDVRCGAAVTTFLINVAVGLTISYITYLLTPKPKQPKFQSRRLDDINQAGRFTPTFGFDSVAELGNYNDPIPIIFGKAKYNESSNYVGGGLLTTPTLVWSRMFSWGTQQSIKQLFVLGEQGVTDRIAPEGIDRPRLQGIYLGNTPLDAVFENFFAFYWKKHHSSENPTYRIKASNFAYGTRGTPESGDPETNDDIFVCPTRDSEADTAFCSTHNLSSNAQFGAYAPIANGCCFRPNWQVVNYVKVDPGTDDPGNVNKFTIHKIAGVGNREDPTTKIAHVRWNGMPGTGRNYSRRMGIINIKNADGTIKHAQPNNTTEVFKVVTVVTGDIAEFVIRPGVEKLDDNWLNYGKVKVGDITGPVTSFRERADDALQLGEVFQIGRTYWQVISRSLPRWSADSGNAQHIHLKCIDDDSPGPGSTSNVIGINSARVLHPLDPAVLDDLNTKVDPTDTSENPIKYWPPRDYSSEEHETRDYVTDSLGGDGLGGVNADAKAPGPEHFPLLKQARALIKTTRECDAIEIGLKSRVYTELTGLCNFQTLPSPGRCGGGCLGDWWRASISTTSGTVNAYIKRASTFVIMVRKTGVQSDGTAYEWEQLPTSFAIIGKEPVDLYNWIRIKHPEKDRYEYELQPLTGATIHRQSLTKPYIVLDSSVGDASNVNTITRSLTTTRYGTFVLSTRGQERQRESFQHNKEFTTDPTFVDIVTAPGLPRQAIAAGHTAVGIDPNRTWNRIFNMRWKGGGEWGTWDHIPPQANRAGGIGSAFNHEIFGTPDRPVGHRKQVWERLIVDGKMINVMWEGEVVACPGHWAEYTNGDPVTTRWNLVAWTFRHPGDEFAIGDLVTFSKSVSNSNPFKVARSPASGPDLTTAARRFKVDAVSGHHELAIHGKAHAVRWEVFGSADSYNVGDTRTVTKDFTKTIGTATCKLRLDITSTVVEQTNQAGNGGWPGINKTWTQPVVSVVQDSNHTTDGWTAYDPGNRADSSFVTISELTGNTNPFFLPNKTIDWEFHITEISQAETEASLYSAARFFEDGSQYADMSYYGDLVRRSNQSSPEHTVAYVNEIIDNEDFTPNYDNLVIAGLSLRAGRQFSNLDQVRFWLKEGLHVRRLHPNLTEAYGDNKEIGASNLFTDLVYYLLTDNIGGAGNLLGITDATSTNLVDKDDMIETTKFLHKNKLWCNGVVKDGSNIRDFISSVAPMFLCDAVLKDGRFSIRPAIPVTTDGDINYSGAVTIKQLFTTGNIIEDSFNVSYLSSEERRAVKATIRYRKETEFGLPKEETIVMFSRNQQGTEDIAAAPSNNNSNDEAFSGSLPIETFDLTNYVTTKHHAKLVGKYFLSVRNRVTHSISFSTTPHGLDLAPGDLIKVSTETTPFSAAATGTINASGVIVSASAISNGSHEVLYYKTGLEEDVATGTMIVSDGIVSDSTFHNSIFTLQVTTDSQDVYRVESITLTEDMIVEITASEFPCNERSFSLIAEDLDPANENARYNITPDI